MLLSNAMNCITNAAHSIAIEGSLFKIAIVEKKSLFKVFDIHLFAF
jgi:hypothetical protein